MFQKRLRYIDRRGGILNVTFVSMIFFPNEVSPSTMRETPSWMGCSVSPKSTESEFDEMLLKFDRPVNVSARPSTTSGERAGVEVAATVPLLAY